MGNASAKFDSAYERRQNIASYVKNGVLDNRVLDELVVNGIAVHDEADLWDFKRELPFNPIEKMHDVNAKAELDAKFSNLVKDAVAFYNSHGGYIIVGVDDATRALVGFNKTFDAADLNKRVQGATGGNVETIYRLLNYDDGEKSIALGLLFIPRRPDRAAPLQFTRAAPPNSYGKMAYAAGDFYLRERDICRPAKRGEDFQFLFVNREQFLVGMSPLAKPTDNNLPPRDHDLGRFIGRDVEISHLWSWLADPYSPVKVLSGLGGVGKTSLAYTFAERLVYQASNFFDKVVWLGAKQTTYSALKGQRVLTQRVDFGTVDSFFIELLLEVGCPASEIPESPARRQLLDLADEHLRAYSYLIIIDDVDTLDDDEQQTIFHLTHTICGQTKSKALITARRNLGAARTVYIEMGGLSENEFCDFVIDKAELLKLKLPFGRQSGQMERFFEASGGSPLFTLSILRLMMLGDSFNDAIRNFRGADGEEVRAAAFRRELGRLTTSSASILLALCYLGEASLVELTTIVGLTRYEAQKALEELQAFSMTSRSADLPGGATFRAPSTLSLMTSLIELRVADKDRIRSECQQRLTLSKNHAPFTAEAIRRTMAFLNSQEYDRAVQTAQAALEKLPNNGDLLCLLGRCFVEYGKDYASNAEENFLKASEHGCTKKELYDGWVRLKEIREDWKGMMDVCDRGVRETGSSRYFVAKLRAMRNLGDARSRIGHYEEAEKLYRVALDASTDMLRTFMGSTEKSQVRAAQESLVYRWLGSVKMLSGQTNNELRFFGACVRAASQYSFINEDLVASAFDALKKWLDRFNTRRQVSQADVDKLCRESVRLGQYREALNRYFHAESRTNQAFEVLAKSTERTISNLLARAA